MSNNILIKDIFKEPIDRPIQGVIQAGQQDDTIILDELKEYVMTDEGTKRMEDFYKHYVSTLDSSTDKIGVWISGFFGSGKSHFLKIMSYLLDHKVVGGKESYLYFENKTKNKELLELMKTVNDSESEVILFNIDSKSSNNVTENDKILDVFLKVFNEFLGYSNTSWIADIERTLDEEGKYKKFKEQFEIIAGSSWENNRSKIAIKRKQFIQAMVNVGYDEETAKGFLDTTKKTFSIDFTGFAKMVSKYCRSKGNKYRLIFLVDEVGQYIGGNTKLMINLQTVVEDLGNYAKGQAWVAVTSQEKIDAIKGDDFSKIQGRFATRLNLSSANADEVIKKRLLSKKDAEYSYLKAKFESQEQSINNKLKFDNHSSSIISGFVNGNEFAESYPFVPYQFILLQDVFENVRLKGEAGKNLAHGERSLLNAFQEIATRMKDDNTDKIAVFAHFYDTIEKFLDSSVVKTISKSANREDLTKYDVQVLKTLYMIKDIEYVKANIENVTTLFIDDINTVKNEVEEKVKASLTHLERVHLIERLADETYIFLSDDEQEMNNFIKKISIDEEKVKGQISKALFEDILKNKTSYKDFTFNRKFNDYARGNAINNITLQIYSGDIQPAKAQMDAADGYLVMLLPSTNNDYEKAFAYCEQIANYNRTTKSSITPAQKRILDQKLEQSSEFSKKGKEALENACKKAKFYIQGKEYTFTGDINNQLERALSTLIENTFTKLHYINSKISLKEAKEKLLDYVKGGYEDLIDIPADKVNILGVEEVKKFLSQNNSYEKKSVRYIVNEFSKIPYGWNENDTLGIICELVFLKKIKFRYLNGSVDVNDKHFIEKLMKVPEQEKLIAELEIEVPQEIKSKALRIIKEFFGNFEVGNNYDSIADAIRNGIKLSMKEPLEQIKARQQRQSNEYPYPGNMLFMKLKNEMEELIYINDSEQLVKEMIDAEKNLYDWFDKQEELSSFYNKTPIEIFDKGVRFLNDKREELSIVAARSSDVQTNKTQIENILKDEKPYKQIPSIELLIKSINEKIEVEKEKEREIQRIEIEKIEKEIESLEDFYSNNPKILEFIKEKRRPLILTISNFESSESFTSIIATSSLLNSQLDKLNKSIEDYSKSLSTANAVSKRIDTSYTVKAKDIKEISISSLINNIDINEAEIDSLPKLENYFDNLKNKLKSELLSELKEYDLVIKK